MYVVKKIEKKITTTHAIGQMKSKQIAESDSI